MQTDKGTLLFTKEGKFKLDVETGEWLKVRPYYYKQITIVAKVDFIIDKLIWESSLIGESYIDEEIVCMQPEDGRGRKPAVFSNQFVYDKLQPCQHYSNAKLSFPFLEPTLKAVGGFHDGSRPISAGLLYKLLSTLTELSTGSVEDATGYSERYCRKIVKALKVASAELSRLMKDYPVVYIEGEIAMWSKEQCLINRTEYIKWFVAQQLLGKYQGFPVPK